MYCLSMELNEKKKFGYFNLNFHWVAVNSMGLFMIISQLFKEFLFKCNLRGAVLIDHTFSESAYLAHNLPLFFLLFPCVVVPLIFSLSMILNSGYIRGVSEWKLYKCVSPEVLGNGDAESKSRNRKAPKPGESISPLAFSTKHQRAWNVWVPISTHYSGDHIYLTTICLLGQSIGNESYL